MKRLASLLLVAGLAGGCLPTQPDGAPWAKTIKNAEVKKEPKPADEIKVEEKPARRAPVVTPEKVTENNTQKIIEEMEAEMKNEAENPPKVIVPARK